MSKTKSLEVIEKQVFKKSEKLGLKLILNKCCK